MALGVKVPDENLRSSMRGKAVSFHYPALQLGEDDLVGGQNDSDLFELAGVGDRVADGAEQAARTLRLDAENAERHAGESKFAAAVAKHASSLFPGIRVGEKIHRNL